MIPVAKINLGKDGGTVQHIRHVIKAWDGKMVLHRDFVDCSTIDTHPPTPVFFWS
jgi:hypothetical protein